MAVQGIYSAAQIELLLRATPRTAPGATLRGSAQLSMNDFQVPSAQNPYPQPEAWQLSCVLSPGGAGRTSLQLTLTGAPETAQWPPNGPPWGPRTTGFLPTRFPPTRISAQVAPDGSF